MEDNTYTNIYRKKRGVAKMRSVINVSEIREIIARIQAYLEIRAEESGMDGDYEYAKMIDGEVRVFTEILTILKGYDNQQLALPFLLSSLEAVAPQLDIEQLTTNLGYLISVKREQIAKLQAELDKDVDYLKQFEFAKDNRHDIQGFSK